LIRIIDLLGRTVIKQPYVNAPINVQNLNAGLYILDIMDAQGNHQRYKLQVR